MRHLFLNHLVVASARGGCQYLPQAEECSLVYNGGPSERLQSVQEVAANRGTITSSIRRSVRWPWQTCGTPEFLHRAHIANYGIANRGGVVRQNSGRL